MTWGSECKSNASYSSFHLSRQTVSLSFIQAVMLPGTNGHDPLTLDAAAATYTRRRHFDRYIEGHSLHDPVLQDCLRFLTSLKEEAAAGQVGWASSLFSASVATGASSVDASAIHTMKISDLAAEGPLPFSSVDSGEHKAITQLRRQGISLASVVTHSQTGVRDSALEFLSWRARGDVLGCPDA